MRILEVMSRQHLQITAHINLASCPSSIYMHSMCTKIAWTIGNIFVTDCTIYNHFTPPVCLTSLVGLYKSWRTGPDQAADKANEKQRISASAGKECIAKRWTSSIHCHLLRSISCSLPNVPSLQSVLLVTHSAHAPMVFHSLAKMAVISYPEQIN